MKHASTTPVLDRRAVLRGAGGIGLALPLLEVMMPRKAQAAAPKRFVAMFSGNGTLPALWEPKGTETDFELSPILKPLEPYRKDINVVQGVDQRWANADGHQGGFLAFLTGMPFQMVDKGKEWGAGPSIDQVVATSIGKVTRFPSLEFGVVTDLEGPVGGWHRMCFAGRNQPIPPENSPYKMFDRVFAGTSADPTAISRLRIRRQSVMDAVLEQYRGLQAKVSGDDRVKLERHASTLREIEMQLARPGVDGVACAKPELGMPLNLTKPPGSYADTRGKQDNFPIIAKLQMDIMAAAFACDLTRVATIQFGRCASEQRFTWLGINALHHEISHEPDTNLEAVDRLTKINTWYAAQLAYLLGKLGAIREGGTTLVDNLSLVWGNELGKGNSHSTSNIPYVLAGRAGGFFKTGRSLRYGDVPNNNLLLSLLLSMGVPATSFGKPEWCKGPLQGLG